MMDDGSQIGTCNASMGQSNTAHLAALATSIWLVLVTSLAVVALVTDPASGQADSVDPGLDTIMKMTPPGFQRAERDRLPKGPMTTATFNAVGVTAVTVRGRQRGLLRR